MTIDMIPLNQLVPSRANVRKTGGSAGLNELAASIEAHGLLQNLQVRPTTKNRFEVVAGGRRLAAMTLLRRAKKLAKDFPVPCHVLADQDAQEISLAENIVRLAMHPADQFIAFQALVDQGKGVEEIAARFGASPAIVRQRLKLASVSPALIGLYREDEMSLDQLMAFTVSDDHRAQEAAWFDQPDYNREPRDIRAHLTAAQVETDDPRVRLIGLEAYREAGGGIYRDLFQPEHEGYLTDAALLDRLVTERLEIEAERVRAEGWAWVEIMPRRDYAAISRCDSIDPSPLPLDEETQARREGLGMRYDALLAAQDDEPDDDTSAELDALSEQIDAIDGQALAWTDEDRACAGVFLSIHYDGSINVERGYVRPEDSRKRAAMVVGPEGEAELSVRKTGLSARLVESLTAERTAALRALLMDDQAVALASLCHALVLPLFYGYRERDRSCVELVVSSCKLADSEEGKETGAAATALDARHAEWKAQLPTEGADLFGWLLAQDQATILRLLAYGTAQGVNAVRGKSDRDTTPRLVHADELAAAVRLDMRDWWSPTKDRYLGKVPKALILEAVSEGVSAQAAENLAALKRDRLIEVAEQRLAGKGWLPAPLRRDQPAQAEAEIEPEAMAAE